MEERLTNLLRQVERQSNTSAAQGREAVPVGPFTALIDPTTDLVWLNYAVPMSPCVQSEVAEALIELRRVFEQRWRIPRFEFIEELWPDLGPSLQEAGLDLQARQPLMLCTPSDFRPAAAPGVRVQPLTGADDDATFTRFLTIGRVSFASAGASAAAPTVEDVARRREHVAAGHERAALGWLDGAAVGVASTLALDDVAELAGVATLPVMRRRGVAVTVSSSLVRDHFDRDGTLVWLSAGDDIAEAVYRRIGFRTVASRLNYIATA